MKAETRITSDQTIGSQTIPSVPGCDRPSTREKQTRVIQYDSLIKSERA